MRPFTATTGSSSTSSGSGAQVATKDDIKKPSKEKQKEITEKFYTEKQNKNNKEEKFYTEKQNKNNKENYDCVFQALPADAARVSGPVKAGGSLTNKEIYQRLLEKEGFIYIGTKIETKLKSVPWHERKANRKKIASEKLKNEEKAKGDLSQVTPGQESSQRQPSPERCLDKKEEKCKMKTTRKNQRKKRRKQTGHQQDIFIKRKVKELTKSKRKEQRNTADPSRAKEETEKEKEPSRGERASNGDWPQPTQGPESSQEQPSPKNKQSRAEPSQERAEPSRAKEQSRAEPSQKEAEPSQNQTL